MQKMVVVIGLGEMSGVFTRGLLKAGHPVYPITRGMSIQDLSEQIQNPEMILVAVGENDLSPVLKQIPTHWRGKIALLQNELLPNDWKSHGLDNPTVISVWFEKKKGQDYKVLVPSPLIGPHARLLQNSLSTLDIPTWVVNNDEEMLFELVRKNLYILTTNIAGLEVGGDVNHLWTNHRELALKVIDDVLTIQFHIINQTLDKNQLIDAMVEAINGDLEHKCMGRSAPARLARALEYAQKYQLSVPELERISLRS